MKNTNTENKKYFEQIYLGTGLYGRLSYEHEGQQVNDTIFFEEDDDFLADVYLTDEVAETVREIFEFNEFNGGGWHFSNGVISDDYGSVKTVLKGEFWIFRSGVNKLTIVANGIEFA